MEKLKHVEFKVAKRIAGFSNTLSHKQCEMFADHDNQVLLVKSREGRKFIVPFGAVNLMEVLDEADEIKHAKEAEEKAKEDAERLAKKNAVLAERAKQAQAQKADVVRFVKNAKGEIEEK